MCIMDTDTAKVLILSATSCRINLKTLQIIFMETITEVFILIVQGIAVRSPLSQLFSQSVYFASV